MAGRRVRASRSFAWATWISPRRSWAQTSQRVRRCLNWLQPGEAVCDDPSLGPEVGARRDTAVGDLGHERVSVNADVTKRAVYLHQFRAAWEDAAERDVAPLSDTRRQARG